LGSIANHIPPHQLLLSTRKQKFSRLTLANSTKERNLRYCLVIGFTQALQMAIPIGMVGLKRTKQLPQLFHVHTRADLISKITGCDYLL